ncbi:MAG TPA: hypothetical protein VNH14_13690 [Gemmatimonadales bacterium]|nr:hypothetical protein [Gemmatimonadales bacterium]
MNPASAPPGPVTAPHAAVVWNVTVLFPAGIKVPGAFAMPFPDTTRFVPGLIEFSRTAALNTNVTLIGAPFAGTVASCDTS